MSGGLRNGASTPGVVGVIGRVWTGECVLVWGHGPSRGDHHNSVLGWSGRGERHMPQTPALQGASGGFSNQVPAANPNKVATTKRSPPLLPHWLTTAVCSHLYRCAVLCCCPCGTDTRPTQGADAGVCLASGGALQQWQQWRQRRQRRQEQHCCVLQAPGWPARWRQQQP